MSVDPSYLSAGSISSALTRGSFRSAVWYGSPQAQGGTSAAQGNSSLKATPFYVPAATAFDRIGIEITVVGEAGSLVRLGVYNDDGTGYPGALLFDAGTVDATILSSTTERSITITQTLNGLVWLAAAVQSAPTTQPTLRTCAGSSPYVLMGQTTPTQASAACAYTQSGVTGAFPGTFTTTVTAAPSSTRVILRKV